MTINPDTVGIDIAKDHLDVFDGRTGRHERFGNDVASAARLAAMFAASGSFVLFEATGPYDRLLRLALEAAGVRFARVNPGRARDFARAAGVLAKTDRVDARMLAAMAAAMRPPADPAVEPQRERLAILHKRRDQLVATRRQERTRRHDDRDPLVTASIAAHLAWLDAEIDTIGRAIAALIRAHPALTAAADLIRSMPGIGPVNAATILALAPELGQRSPKQIAALAGLAPINRDSGKFRGKRTIGHGRKRLRDALYLAAVTASRSRTRLAAFYRSLRHAGKPPKVALIALARKILVTLNAIARDQTPFRA
jgi:transposase